MTNAPRVDYQTHPIQNRHWRLKFEGPVVTLAVDFDEHAGLAPGCQLKLNSYFLDVDIELNDPVNKKYGVISGDRGANAAAASPA